MKYRLKILERARLEAEDIFEWLAERSPSGANRWWNAFESAATTVPTRPFSYPLAQQ